MRPSLSIAFAGLVAAMLGACNPNGGGGGGGGADATIQIQCSGNSDAKVAIRWSHPDYDSSDPFMPLWSVPCSNGTATKQLTVTQAASQFEIQTEGGPQTSYMVSVTINGQNGTGDNNITITHSGEGDPVVHGNDVGITRSSDPNEYGEQNFRVTIPPGSAPNVKVIADSSGDRSDAQMALRWGHPDFNNNEYFSLWTIKPSAKQEKQFRLPDQNSEFEIQTEGGKGTRYGMSIWFDFGSGFKNEPSIEISHQRARTEWTIGTTDVTFTPNGANATGEMTVNVNAPWITATPPPTQPSGFEGSVYVCKAFDINSVLHLKASTSATASGTNKTSMSEDIPIVFSQQTGGTWSATFRTQQVYQPGTWSITSVTLDGNYGALSGLPLTQPLPGTVGQPVFDFRGGPCN